jgi:plastocyanin
MRRHVLLAALVFSTAVHAFLAPEHLREEPSLGALFVAGAIVEAILVVLLLARPSRGVIGGATVTLAGMLVAYLPFVLFHLPGFAMTPEPVERIALLTKIIELAGVAAGITLLARPAPRPRRLGPAAVTILAAGVAAGIAAPPSLAGGMGAERSVDIPGQFYSPDAMPVLVGDTVTWTNHDHLTHTATSDDFDSGRLAPGAHFSLTFTKPGVYRYHCSIHRFMHGEVHVSAVALIAPLGPVPLGSTVTLTGLAPGGVESVALERQQPDGTYLIAASVAPSADGSFSFRVPVSEPAHFRVRAGDQSSDPVAVRPEPDVTISVRRAGSRATVVAAAAPDQAGATIAVERYVRERYLWMPVRQVQLGASGRVSLTVPAKRRGIHFRAHLLRAKGGWGEANSKTATLP